MTQPSEGTPGSSPQSHCGDACSLGGSQPAWTSGSHASGERHQGSMSPGQQLLHLLSKEMVPNKQTNKQTNISCPQLLLLLLTDTHQKEEMCSHPPLVQDSSLGSLPSKPPGPGEPLSAISLPPLH